jgi:hypothetical protein
VAGQHDITRFAGSAAAISLAVSVSYHLGYLLVVDPKLVSFFSLEDVIGSALHFLPIVVVAWIIRNVLLQFKRPGLSGSKHLARTIFSNPIGQVPIAFLIMVTIFLFTAKWAAYLLAYSFVVMIILQDVIFKIEDDLKRFYYLDVGYLGFFLVVTFFSGAAEAQTDLTPKPLKYEVEFSDGHIVNVDLMRAGSNFILVRYELNTVSIISTSDIKSVKFVGVIPPSARISWRDIWEDIGRIFAKLRKAVSPEK